MTVALMYSGLRIPQFRLLDLLAQAGRATVTEMSEKLHVTRATASVMINELIKAGLVTMAENIADRRSFHIYIAEPGLTNSASPATTWPSSATASPPAIRPNRSAASTNSPRPRRPRPTTHPPRRQAIQSLRGAHPVNASRAVCLAEELHSAEYASLFRPTQTTRFQAHVGPAPLPRYAIPFTTAIEPVTRSYQSPRNL